MRGALYVAEVMVDMAIVVLNVESLIAGVVAFPLQALLLRLPKLLLPHSRAHLDGLGPQLSEQTVHRGLLCLVLLRHDDWCMRLCRLLMHQELLRHSGLLVRILVRRHGLMH